MKLSKENPRSRMITVRIMAWLLTEIQEKDNDNQSLMSQQAAGANVHDLEDVLAACHASGDQGDKTQHRNAPVPHLCSRREAALSHERREQTIRLLIGLAIVERERVAKNL